MFRYRLRTLLIVLALGPLVVAGAWLGRSIIAIVVPQVVVFLGVVFCIVAVGVACAMGMASMAETVIDPIDPWQRKSQMTHLDESSTALPLGVLGRQASPPRRR